jgi:uncharacterized protein YdeI (YjbR/CyaY-like superfamily)
MGTKDKRVDAYIAKSPEFAQPILRELREIVHQGCPQVDETIKWRFPNFEYKGLMAGMAAFKEHCSFGFWKHSLIVGKGSRDEGSMGSFGRITSMKDLPPRKTLLGYVKKAAQLNDQGAKVPRKVLPRDVKRELKVPTYFTSALKKNKKALATFAAFPYGKKRDYVEWITEAKTDETRARRLETSVAWLAEGKSRNWKYERC